MVKGHCIIMKKTSFLLCMLTVLTMFLTGLAMADGMPWPIGISYVSGFGDIFDQYEDNLKAKGYWTYSIDPWPVGISFQPYYQWDEGFRLGGGIGPIMMIYGDADDFQLPLSVTAGRPATEIMQPESEQPKAEPEKPKPEEPKPVEVSPAPDRLLRRNAYYIGPELYSFKYEEPGYMEEEGMFYGIAFGYTYRGWVPDSPEHSFSDNKMMARLEGRFALGEVDYDGAAQDPGTGEIIPITIDGIDDFALEGRLLLGPEWLGSNTLSTLYAGIGYRYLNDDPSIHPSGYERESNYCYVPIGYEMDTNLQADWSWLGRVEFDFLLWGVQKSHLSDLNPMLPDVENDQDSGYGYRASIKLQKKSTDVMFVIEPFFRYWDIDKSEVEFGSVFEPANETTEYGIQFIWMF